MNRTAIAFGALLWAPLTHAGTAVMSAGPQTTFGPTSNHYSLHAGSHNPAMADLTVAPDERWRFGYFAGFGTTIELGDANSFIDEVDELVDLLDDPSLTEDSVEETLDRFNNILVEMGEEGYVKHTTSLYVPGMPAYFRPGVFAGTMYLEAAVDVQWRVSLLDDQLRFNDQNGSYETNSSAYIKSGIQQRVGLGYGREIGSGFSFGPLEGRLHAGAKLNLYNLELSKQVFQLQQLDGKDIEDVVEDEYENNQVTTTAAGLDVGFVWDAGFYRLGLTLNDINSPEFDYGPVGVNCEDLEEDTVSRSNCEVTRYFTEVTGDIASHETHTKHATSTIDLTLFPTERWSISSSYELAKYDDLVGAENQWLSLSAAYNTTGWLPGVRAGLKKNLAGSELTTYSVGLTLLKVFNLDVAASSESVEHDGDKAPRQLSFALSFEETF